MGEPSLEALERRSEPRQDVGNEVVSLNLGDGRVDIQCCIWNISAHGACLMIPPDHALPGRFDVLLPAGRRTAEVVWRQWSHVGIKFVG